MPIFFVINPDKPSCINKVMLTEDTLNVNIFGIGMSQLHKNHA